MQRYKLIGDVHRQRSRGKVSETYSQRYRLLNETRKRVVSLKTTDRATARRVAVATVELAIEQLTNGPDKFAKHAQTPILDHLTAFIDDLVAEEKSPKHVRNTDSKIKAIIAGCQFKRIGDLDAPKVKAFLKGKRDSGEHSEQTTVRWVAAIKTFSKWLAKHERTKNDPLSMLQRQPTKGEIEPTYKRRHFSTAELNRLLANARKGETVHGLTGEQRVYLYLVASGTGYRAHELSTITAAACHLDDEPPYVEVACTISKRRKFERQPIHPDLAAKLRDFVSGKPAHQRLWPGGWWRKACKIMTENDFAGIKAETDEGRLEFHSLRHTFVTGVVATGANQLLAMDICRLSDPKLLDRYNHFVPADRLRVVNALPVPKLPKAGRGHKAG